MKMVKKILLGITAAAAVMTFASCGAREEAGNSSIIDVNAGSSKASIDTTNDGTEITRGFKTLQTKHTDAILKVSSYVTGDSCDGAMGYIFDYKKNDDESLDFSIACARIVKNSDKKWEAQAYVETFRNVNPDTLESGDNFYKADGSKAFVSKNGFGAYDPAKKFGNTIIAAAEADEYVKAQKAAGKPIDLWIELVANLGPSVEGRDGDAGTYTVNFYNEDPKRSKDGDKLKYGANKDRTAETVGCRVATVTVPKTSVNNAFTTALPQTEQGFYATVYAGQTLKGEWQFAAIRQEAEEIEE